MNKKELIALLGRLDMRRCPLRHGGQCGCGCQYSVDGIYGNECLFDAMTRALEEDKELSDTEVL